ncbi:MAG: hypothetical protein IJ137_01950 [Eubacterium sp.]|nr:hypothetical protein [Eubacterium sp.]
MNIPFSKKNETKAAIDRQEKIKVDEDRTRIQGIRVKLETLKLLPYGSQIQPEDIPTLNGCFDETIRRTDRLIPVHFDVTAIDQYMDGIVDVLRLTKDENGTKETMLRCFAGLGYGLMHGHKEVPANAVEAEVVRRRNDMMSRYLQLCTGSYEIDKLRGEIEKKQIEKGKRQKMYEASRQELQDMIDAHPSIWHKVHTMTADERTKLSGQEQIMAAKMNESIERRRVVDQIEKQIGQCSRDIVTIESMTSAMAVTLKSWENNIDEQSMAEIHRLTEAYVKDELAKQKIMKGLEVSVDELDKAIDRLYAGQDAKEWVIEVTEKFDSMVNREKQQEIEDEKGRELLRKQKLEEQKQKEKQKHEAAKSENKRLLN